MQHEPTTAGFASLDEVDLAEVFEVGACVMKSIPKFMRGAYRWAMKVSLQEIQRGSAANNSTVETRGWKLFFLLPRLLLFKPLRGGLSPFEGGCRSACPNLRLVSESFSFVSHWKVCCRASMQVAVVAEDSETLLPVGSPAQLGWRISESCPTLAKHWKEMQSHQAMRGRGSC